MKKVNLFIAAGCLLNLLSVFVFNKSSYGMGLFLLSAAMILAGTTHKRNIKQGRYPDLKTFLMEGTKRG